MKRFLLIEKIQVEGANAFSSPYSIGFPQMTSFLGFVHKIERDFNSNNDNKIFFKKTGVIVYDFNLQSLENKTHYALTGQAYSAKYTVKNEIQRPSFIPEPRCDMCVSLLIEYEEELEEDTDEDEIKDYIDQKLLSLRLCSGNIVNYKTIKFFAMKNDCLSDHPKLMSTLMPGFCLIERKDLMVENMEKGNDALDALFHFMNINYSCEIIKEQNGKIENFMWKGNKAEKGWIIPLTVGYQKIADGNESCNLRTHGYIHKFVEPIVTLCEFVMPYRIENINQILWYYQNENGIYSCR